MSEKPKIAANIDDEDATRLWRIYEATSKNIERENTLIGFRVTWAIFLTAGIVAAESFIAAYSREAYPIVQNPGVHVFAQSMILFLSFLALFFCVWSTIGVRAAQIQMDHVKKIYRVHKSKFIELGLPRPYGSVGTHFVGNYNAIVYPVVLLFLWIVLSTAQAARLNELTGDYYKDQARKALQAEQL